MPFDLTPSRQWSNRGASAVAAVLLGILWQPPKLVSQAAPAVAQIEVAPPTVTLSVGGRQGVLATAYDARGQVLATARITWSSTNVAVARVEQDPREPGVATIIGVAPGIVSIEATAGGRRGQVAVQVTGAGATAPPPVVPAQPTIASNVVAIRIEPNSFYVLPSEDLRVSLLFLQGDGSPATPTPVTWRSLNEAVATVDQSGTVVGIAPGNGVIEARTPNDLVARAFVQVAGASFSFANDVLSLSPGEDDTVRLIVPQQGNRRIPSRFFSWTSSNPSVVLVSPLGVATGVSAGRAEVYASGFGQTARLTAVVHRVVEELAVSPPPSAGAVTVPLSGTARFNAQPLDSAGQPVTEAPLVWDVADTSVASFNPETKLATGKKIGRTTLRVRGPGRGLQATWTVDVVAGGLGFRPPRMGLSVNERRAIEVMFTNDRGEALAPATGITWTSGRPTVAQVDAQGTVTGVDYGYAPIIATTSWGKTDTVHVYVAGELLVTSTRLRSQDLFTFDRGTARFVRLTTDSVKNEFEGSYSPDGSRIAFVNDRDGNPELYIMNADGSGARRLTNSPDTEGSPSWTPDGQQLVYASNATGHFQLWIINVDGTGARRLTEEPSSNFQPAVSPDGKLIAFSTDRERPGGYEVYVMSIDGSNQRNVSRSPASETAPAWFPDGQLAYISQEQTRNTITSRIMKANPAGSEPASVLVSLGAMAAGDIEISRNGEIMAVMATTFEQRGGVSQPLYLYSVANMAAPPVEVPRAGPTDRLGSPSFRR
ncbi:MAG TPA: Ig-like domain-containing protein [Gemmatimonadales bacterium]|nr:Ig-like domain-containing protein [Gemmatimonadales bacterium]